VHDRNEVVVVDALELHPWRPRFEHAPTVVVHRRLRPRPSEDVKRLRSLGLVVRGLAVQRDDLDVSEDIELAEVV
jgi:hypothetical protein